MIRKYITQDFEINIDVSDEHVFQPHPITLLLANAIKVKSTDIVLEVGCGSGFLSITAAKLGARKVYASDITAPAVQATRLNADLNSINGQINVVTGDFFEPFKNKLFDIIISNPPCMPFPENKVYRNKGLSLAVDGGVDGTNSIIRLLQTARFHLKPDGVLYIPVPKWSDWSKIMSLLNTYYKHETVSQGKVHYYLGGYDPSFLRHFETLIEKDVVEVDKKNGLPAAEILIKRARIKSPTYDFC